MPRKNTIAKLPAAESAQEDSKEAKKQRRLIRNRLSAQMHRERQRAYMSGLQHQVAALSAERDLWRQAFDTMAAKHCVVTGQDLSGILSGILLPVPAEQVAPSPPPATGQAARGPDGSDIMAELMDRAKTTILPRGRAAEEDTVARTSARILSTMASGEAASDTSRPGPKPRSSRRRSPKRRHDSEDESDDTEATAGRQSAGEASDSEWVDADSPAKRPALVQPPYPGRRAVLDMPMHAPLPFDHERELGGGISAFVDRTEAEDAFGEDIPEDLADVLSPSSPVAIDPSAAIATSDPESAPSSLPPLLGVDEDPEDDLGVVVPPPPVLDIAAMASRQVSTGSSCIA